MTTDLMAAEVTTAPHERRRCTGTSKQTGQPCGQSPVPGATVCHWHGGKAPQTVAAAERRQQEAAAQLYVARYGLPQHIEWHEAIPNGIDESYGNVLALRDLVQRLAPEALTWGTASEVTVGSSQFPGVDITKAAGIAPVVALYGQERDRLHRMAVDAGKLNLDARRQAFAERDAVDAVQAMRDTFADPRMKATAEQLELGPRILAEKLRARALAGGEATA